MQVPHPFGNDLCQKRSFAFPYPPRNIITGTPVNAFSGVRNVADITGLSRIPGYPEISIVPVITFSMYAPLPDPLIVVSTFQVTSGIRLSAGIRPYKYSSRSLLISGLRDFHHS